MWKPSTIIISAIILWFVEMAIALAALGLLGRQKGYAFFVGIKRSLKTRKDVLRILLAPTLATVGYALIIYYLA